MAEMKKVLVGMSGGVDSSAAALLLKIQGYDVTGCTMKMFDNSVLPEGMESSCCSADDTADARSVCSKLGIRHHTFNGKDGFMETVIKPFCEDYINGRTPNPCINCNRYMKFGEMLRKAETLGFDYIATGHYARIVFDGETGKYQLHRPDDKRKDQTYVLYQMTQHMLEHTLFPLYGMEKAEIRTLAEEHGLINSRKPDSQDICFVPDGDYAGCIRRIMPDYEPQKGDFIGTDGARMGTHSGIINYTIGQRKGLGVSFGKPVFVTAIDSAANTVTLGDSADLMKRTVWLSEMNIISGELMTEPMEVTAKVRYSAAEQKATVYPEENGLTRVEFEEPVRAPARGQACVLYSGSRVIGGGTIEKSE